MRKRIILVMLVLAVILSMSVMSYAADKPKLNSKSAILVDAYTGAVLYEKNADDVREPASMTKMMTAILVVEKLKLDDKVTISKHVKTIGGSAIGLKPKEEVKVKDLLGAMLVYSANDCAVALAEAVSGSEAEFGKLMTERAKELGCTATVFKNPSGLHEDGHVSTARDMAIIARAAVSYDEIAEIVQMTTYKMEKTNKRPAVTVGSSDRLLFDDYSWITVNGKSRHPYYKYAKGIKTGYTPEAGGCLATYAVKGDKRLISVVMKSTDMKRFADAIKILDYGFESFEAVTAVNEGEAIADAEVSGGTSKTVEVTAAEDVTLMTEDLENVSVENELSETIKAPVEKGEKLGVCKVKRNGGVVAEVDLLATADIEQTFISKQMDKGVVKIIFVIVILAVAAGIAINVRKKSKQY